MATLELDLQQDTSSAVQAIDDLTSALVRLKEAAGVTQDLKDFATAIRGLSKLKNVNLSEGFEKAKSSIVGATQNTQQMTSAVMDLGSRVNELVPIVTKSFAEMESAKRAFMSDIGLMGKGGMSPFQMRDALTSQFYTPNFTMKKSDIIDVDFKDITSEATKASNAVKLLVDFQSEFAEQRDAVLNQTTALVPYEVPPKDDIRSSARMFEMFTGVIKGYTKSLQEASNADPLKPVREVKGGGFASTEPGLKTREERIREREANRRKPNFLYEHDNDIFTPFPGTPSWLEAIENAKKKLKEEADAVTDVGETFKREETEKAQSIRQSTEALNEQNSKLREMSANADAFSKASSHTMDGFSGKDAFKDIEASAMRLPRVFKSISTHASSLVSGLKEVGSVVGQVGGILARATGAFMAFNGVVGAVGLRGILSLASAFKDRLATGITKVLKPLNTLGRSITRIAMTRAIRGAIMEVVKGLREGVTNLYQWSVVTNGPFRATMDSLATSFLYLKNSIGAAVSPIITALTPAINVAIDAIVSLVNALNQLFSILGGALSWTKAVKAPQEFAKAASGAGGAAKDASDKMKDFVMGFDELNLLSNKNSSGGGGGGGGGLTAEDYALMFENAEYADWAELMKQKIELGDWEGAGRVLGGKVNGIINSIDFEGFGKEFATKLNNAVHFAFGVLDEIDFVNLGVGIATFLNQVFDPEQVDWETIGALWGKKITIFADLIYGAVDQFNWENFGQSMANGINGWLDEVGSRLPIMAMTINEGIQGITLAFNTLLDGVDWKGIGTALGDFVNDIDLVGNTTAVMETISNTVTSLGSMLSNFITTVDWSEFGTAVYEGLKAVDWSGVFSTFWELVGGVLGATFSIGDAILSGIGTDLKTYLDNAFKDPVDEEGNVIGNGFLNGMKTVLTDAGSFFTDNIIDPFITSIVKAFGGEGEGSVMHTLGIDQGESFMSGFKKTFNESSTDLGDELKTTWEGAKTKLEGLWKALSENGSATWNEFLNFLDGKNRDTTVSTESEWQTLDDVINEHAENAEVGVEKHWGGVALTTTSSWQNVSTQTKEKWLGVENSIKTTWNNVKASTKEAVENLKEQIGEKWEEFKTNTAETYEEIRKKISDKWNEVKTNTAIVWTAVKTDLALKWENIKSDATTKFENIRSTIAEKWEKVKSDTSAKWETIKTVLSLAWFSITGKVKETWEGIKKTIGDKWEEIRKATSEKWDAIKTVIKDKIDEAKKKIDELIKAVEPITSKFNTAKEGVEKAVKAIGDVIDRVFGPAIELISDLVGAFEDLAEAKREANRVKVTNTGGISLHGGSYDGPFASGGFPTEGQLFLAREAGPEMVGTINGSTAVANNDQIVSGITQGVTNANASVVQAIYTLISAVNDKDMSVSIGDDAIGRANARYQSSRGASVNRGAFANSY